MVSARPPRQRGPATAPLTTIVEDSGDVADTEVGLPRRRKLLAEAELPMQASRRPCAMDAVTQEVVLNPSTSPEFALEFIDVACTCCSVAARRADSAPACVPPDHKPIDRAVRICIGPVADISIGVFAS